MAQRSKPVTTSLKLRPHQAANSSADMVFGLSLTAAVSYPVYNVDTNQPYDQTVLAGKSVTFTSDVIGSGPLTYQWIFDGTNAIAGATSSTYTIPSLLTNNAGTYTLVVSNASSQVATRSAVLTVSSTPVIITSQPTNVVAVEGTPATFSVSVTATPTILYQWFHNSTNITGATNASYAIASVASSDAGSYYVTVSNPADTTNSIPVTLTVLADRIPPALIGITASYTQVVVTFSKPLDPVTSANASHYAIGGISVVSAVQNPSNPAQVTLTTGAPMSFGAVYTLTVSGVDDLYGNAASTSGQFTPRYHDRRIVQRLDWPDTDLHHARPERQYGRGPTSTPSMCITTLISTTSVSRFGRTLTQVTASSRIT